VSSKQSLGGVGYQGGGGGVHGSLPQQSGPPGEGHEQRAAVSQPLQTNQGGSEGNNPVFQGMTVQQLLEAHMKIVKQELDRQRQEQSVFQFQIQQQLLGCQAGGGLAWPARPSS
jgi:hypothetical protein